MIVFYRNNIKTIFLTTTNVESNNHNIISYVI